MGVVLHAGVVLKMLGWVSLWDLDGQGGWFALLTFLSTLPLICMIVEARVIGVGSCKQGGESA